MGDSVSERETLERAVGMLRGSSPLGPRVDDSSGQQFSVLFWIHWFVLGPYPT